LNRLQEQTFQLQEHPLQPLSTIGEHLDSLLVRAAFPVKPSPFVMAKGGVTHRVSSLPLSSLPVKSMNLSLELPAPEELGWAPLVDTALVDTPLGLLPRGCLDILRTPPRKPSPLDGMSSMSSQGSSPESGVFHASSGKTEDTLTPSTSVTLSPEQPACEELGWASLVVAATPKDALIHREYITLPEDRYASETSGWASLVDMPVGLQPGVFKVTPDAQRISRLDGIGFQDLLGSSSESNITPEDTPLHPSFDGGVMSHALLATPEDTPLHPGFIGRNMGQLGQLGIPEAMTIALEATVAEATPEFTPLHPDILPSAFGAGLQSSYLFSGMLADCLARSAVTVESPIATKMPEDEIPKFTECVGAGADEYCKDCTDISIPKVKRIGSACVSAGSENHPVSCAAPCKFAAKSRGCKDGANCSFCHICVWTREAVRSTKR
jgi:hypothetical protein